MKDEGVKGVETRRAETILMCTHCNALFPAPIRFNSSHDFESIGLNPVDVTCPKCDLLTPCCKEYMINIERIK